VGVPGNASLVVEDNKPLNIQAIKLKRQNNAVTN